MFGFILRRILYAIPVIICVNLLLFVLFFFINTPEDMARTAIGGKNINQKTIDDWLAERNYNLPTFYNSKKQGLEKIYETIFWKKSIALLAFDLGESDKTDRNIWQDLKERIPYSLCLMIPMMIIGMIINVFLAMIIAFYRGSYIDTLALFTTVVLMSISPIFYIILGQLLFSKILNVAPVSGFSENPMEMWRFLVLPLFIGIVSGIGGGIRYYRTLFLEEIGQDYIRTARAKGLSEGKVLFKHALKNSMLPILTNLVLSIPFLIMGNMLLEKFFAIPGLGDYMIQAIQKSDFSVVRAMVFIGSVMYVIGLICVDISYTIIDPRIRLK